MQINHDLTAVSKDERDHRALRADEAVLVVSEELDELFEICDRLVVIAQGRVSPSVKTADASIEMIGEWMSGLWPNNNNNVAEVSHAAA